MDLPALIALTVCCAVILAKMLISLRLRVTSRVLEVENDQFKAAEKELHRAVNNGKRLEENCKQLEVQKKSLTGAIERLRKELEEVRRQKAVKDSVDAQQQTLAERLRRQIG